jgi:hypothetical protein
LEVIHEGSKPVIAKKLVIGTNCGARREVPEHMRANPPETSRMLDALKKQHESTKSNSEVATRFREFWEGAEGNV